MSSEGEQTGDRTPSRPRRAAAPTTRGRVARLLHRPSPGVPARRARPSEGQPDPTTPGAGTEANRAGGRAVRSPAERASHRSRIVRAVLPVAVAVALGVSITGGLTMSAPTAESAPTSAAPTQRADRPNRDADRPTLAPTTPTTLSPASSAQPIERVAATGTRWTTARLDLRTQPTADAVVHGTVASGTKVGITRTSGAYTGVLRDGVQYWVTSRYLAKTEPAGSGPVSSAPCKSGSAVESGLTPDAIRVHRAVCHEFPSFLRFGGVRADALPDHPSGRAVDNMLPGGASDNALGWTVARWLRAHASELGISYIQFDQHIWSVQRSSEGWRVQADRGGVTANHRDHVHVTVFGNRGTT